MHENLFDNKDLKKLDIPYEIQNGRVIKLMYKLICEADGILYKARVVELDSNGGIVKESKTYGTQLTAENILQNNVDSTSDFVLRDALSHAPFNV